MAEKKTEVTEDKIPQGEELVSIRIPLSKEEQADVFVRVNHRTWLIKRGVTVKVPKCVVEVLENSERALREEIEYRRSKEKKAD